MFDGYWNIVANILAWHLQSYPQTAQIELQILVIFQIENYSKEIFFTWLKAKIKVLQVEAK